MMLHTVGPRQYYDLSPKLQHGAGDIWTNLSSLGALRIPSVSGIIITPACDLANDKTESITFLPILSLPDFVSTLAFLPDTRRDLNGQLQAIDAKLSLDSDRRFEMPHEDVLSYLEQAVSARLEGDRVPEKLRIAIDRSQAGLRLIHDILRGSPREETLRDLRLLKGQKAFEQFVQGVITNSYRSDIHFLPRDGEPEEWSGMPKPSVVLFRFPLTVPAVILDDAQNIDESSWSDHMTRRATAFPAAKLFAAIRPMKRLSLRTAFVSDMITRFLSVYLRLGSPDFSAETVSTIAATITD